MKTPMQELFEILQEDQYCGSKSNFAKSFLEKEKEQIKEAYKKGEEKKAEGANQYYDCTFNHPNQAGI